MTVLTVSACLEYDVFEDTSFAMSIVAARTSHQAIVSEYLETTPWVGFVLEPYGAADQQLLRFDAPQGPLRIDYSATVSLDGRADEVAGLDEIPFGSLPADVIPYLNPSRYCESDLLGRFAERLFGTVESGSSRVQAIADWVQTNLRYEPGTTDGSSGTADVLLQRAGVCRDFAHVAISLCRAVGIPARYVSGYGLGVEPQDFHGFFEAYIGNGWHLFDPTGMAPVDGLVRIGVGRDAADTPFASFVGNANLTWKFVTVFDNPGSEPQTMWTA